MKEKTVLSWVDGSPYLFQSWHHPSPSTVSPSIFFRVMEGSLGNWTRRDTTLFPSYSPTLEPKVRSDSACTAAVRQTSSVIDIRWIMIPCDKKHVGASYICESKTAEPRTDDVNPITTILRSHTECAAQQFVLGGMCLFVYTVLSPLMYNVEGVCTSLRTEMFELPKFIFSKPATAWTSEEWFAAATLLTMNHRWPSLVDYGMIKSKFLDKLLLQLPGSKAKYAPIHYSTTSFNYMFKEGFQHFSSATIHIACQAPLGLANQQCLIAHHTCDDGTCILNHYVCDGISDCPDGSDEIKCDNVCFFMNVTSDDPMNCYSSCFTENCTCNDLYFHCSDGGCVPWSRMCDGRPDCPNKEDEVSCHFIMNGSHSPVKVIERSDRIETQIEDGNALTYSSCSDGQNILEWQMNDLVPDCSDQSDENLYDEFLRNGSSLRHFHNRVLCKEPDETTCEKNFIGVCYPRHLYCVYEVIGLVTVGCRNGGHLKECKHHKCPSQFKCPDAYCVPTHVVCNGRSDCPNGEDEIDCNSFISCPGYLLCRYDHICVHPNDVWNSHVKCLQSEDDKALVNYILCPTPCQCLGYAVFCSQPKGSTNQSDIKQLFNTKSSIYIRSLIIRNIGIDLGDNVWKESPSFFLIQLEISNSNLSKVQGHHFSKMTFVRTLNLSHNEILYIAHGAFINLKNLETLDLNCNHLMMLNSSMFDLGVSKLQVLSIRSNKLHTIETCILTGFRYLKSLDLSKNKISSLQNMLCHNNISKLQNLDLSENPLRHLHLPSLKPVLHGLQFLNTTPASICCFIPHLKQCFPKQNFDALSCKHLFMTPLFRFFYWVAGILILILESLSLVWIIQEIRLKKSIINCLTLFSLIFGLLHGFYFLSISVVDYIFSNYYSFYHEIWESHIACSLINILSYATHNMELFVSIMIACTRMIAIAFPLRAAHISISGALSACLSWYLLSLVIGSLPSTTSTIFSASKDGHALGFGLLLPSVVAENWSWSVGAILIPMGCNALVFISCSIVALWSVRNSKNRFKESSKHGNQRSYMHTMWRIVNTLVLTISGYTPLFTIHILKLCGYLLNRRAVVVITSSFLFIVPAINLVLYVATSTNFKRFVVSLSNRLRTNAETHNPI